MNQAKNSYKIKSIFSKIMSDVVEFLKGEKSFYKYTKQTILHLLYRLFVALGVLFSILLTTYSLVNENKTALISLFLYIIFCVIVLIILFIVFVHVYYIFIKKDITPLQSENHQIAKEFLTKVQGDSLSGMIVIDGIKALTQDEGQKQDSLH